MEERMTSKLNSSRSNWLPILLLTVAVVISGAANTFAANVPKTEATAYYGFQGGLYGPNETVTNSAYAHVEWSSSSPYREVQTTASANYGSLGGYAYAAIPGYVNHDVYVSQGSATSSWLDYWTVASSRTGSCTVRINWSLHGSITTNESYGAMGEWYYWIDSYHTNGSSRPGGSLTLDRAGFTDVTFAFNQERSIWSRLHVTAGGSSGSIPIGSTGIVTSDFLSTAQVTGISVLVNGEEISDYTLQTASGHDYSAVPLPSALLLLGPGLAALAVIRRRFRE
jgi:hypothetical protein